MTRIELIRLIQNLFDFICENAAVDCSGCHEKQAEPDPVEHLRLLADFA